MQQHQLISPKTDLALPGAPRGVKTNVKQSSAVVAGDWIASDDQALPVGVMGRAESTLGLLRLIA